MTETFNSGPGAAIAQQAALRRRLPAPPMRRAIRVAAGFTGAEVAATLGVSRQAVAQWERGTRTPRGTHLRAYLEVLDALSEVGR